MIKKVFAILTILALFLWMAWFTKSAYGLDTLKYAVCDTSKHKDAGYDSLFVNWTAWEALNLNLPTLNSICIVDFYNDGDTMKTWSALVINGWETSDSERIKMQTPASERHDGTRNSGFRVTTSDGAPLITISDAHVSIEGLALHQSQAYNIIYLAALPTPTDIRIFDCLFTGTATTEKAIYVWDGDAKSRIYNNIFDGITGASGMGIWVYIADSVWIYNNTLYNIGAIGIRRVRREYDAVFVKNNVVVSGGPAFLGDFDASSDYNCSWDTTAPGTHSIKDKAAYDIFVDTTSSDPDLHLKANSVCIDSGVDLSSDPDLPFSDDIDGDTRTGTWDIGADEYIAEEGEAIKRVYKSSIKDASVR